MDPSGYCHRNRAGLEAFCCRLSARVGSAAEWPPDFLSAALKEWGFHGFSIRGGLGLRSLPLAFPLRWLCASFASAQALALFMPSAPSKLHRLLTSLCPTKTSFRQLLFHILLSLSLLSASVRALALPFRFLPPLTNPGLDQALDRLVSSSFIRCRTFTDDLSTSSSLRGLTCF